MRGIVTSLFLAFTLAACKGEVGPMGPQGPAGPAGAAGPTGATGPAGSLNRAVGTAVIDDGGSAALPLPTSIVRATKPAVVCYTTDNPANDVWLYVGGLSEDEPKCAVLWSTSQNRWVAALISGTPGWTALFIATW